LPKPALNEFSLSLLQQVLAKCFSPFFGQDPHKRLLCHHDAWDIFKSFEKRTPIHVDSTYRSLQCAVKAHSPIIPY